MRVSRMNNQLQLVYSAGTTLAVAGHVFRSILMSNVKERGAEPRLSAERPS